MLTKPTLDIVIVNWNSGTQLRDCLASIVLADKRELVLSSVIVVDNGSHDGSGVKIEGIDLPLTVIKNRHNHGFSRACNQGARSGNADCILFLNPDMRLFENSLVIPVTFLVRAKEKKIGIVGIQLVDGSGNVSKSCARFPNPKMMLQQMVGLDRIFPNRIPGHFLSEWGHRENRQVDQVMGAFFMVRRCLFEKLDGFDERFFVYYEDLDFSLRAKKLGCSSWYLADAAAYHRGCGTSDAAKKERLAYYLRSRILYGFKHFDRKLGLLLMLGTLIFEPVSRVMLALLHFSGREIADTLKGFLLLLRNQLSIQAAGRGGPK